MSLTPAEVARRLGNQTNLAVLVGDWFGGGALVASQPLASLVDQGDPFDAVCDVPSVYGARPGAVGGCWIGYLGYQLSGLLEHLPPSPPALDPLPRFVLNFYDNVLHFDEQAKTWWFEALETPGRAEAIETRFRELIQRLEAPDSPASRLELGPFSVVPGKDEHLTAVRAAIDYIHRGDIFQSNITTRLEADFCGDVMGLYLQGLHRLTPAYSACLKGPWGALASLSPELFLRRTGRRVLTRPIKGTAARRGAPVLDARARAGLVESQKDQAENLMIVDLMRNDLGRICEPGSIQVPSLRAVIPQVGVWHLVSEVHGTLNGDVTDADLLRATFPPGSVTGAPKVRAMEIIHELEGAAREVYTGTVLASGPLIGLESNVAIRTFEFSAGRTWLGVGGGIVADSDPASEFEECLAKARPLLDAVGARLVRPKRRNAARSEQSPYVDKAKGVFETLLAVDGVPLEAAAHLHRLEASTTRLYGSRAPSRVLRQALAFEKRPSGLSRLRLQAWPRADSDNGPTLEFACTSEKYLPEPDSGTTLAPVEVPGGLGRHKWRDRRLVDQFQENASSLPVITDGGQVLEASRANVFAVLEGLVVTPPADGRLLAGITRQRVMSLLNGAGFSVREATLTVGMLAKAEEVFLTSSLRGVEWVSACVGLKDGWSHGSLTKAAAALIDEHRRVTLARLQKRDPVHVGREDAAYKGFRVIHPVQAHPQHPQILVIDNYDSFTYNLVQFLAELGATSTVIRNDFVTVEQASCLKADAVVISPGPGGPEEAGISTRLIESLDPSVPILGICLGHQCIAAAFGARVGQAVMPVHGKTSLVSHDGRGFLRGVPNGFRATRYHSLRVEECSLPANLAASAWSDDCTLMGIRHLERPVEGLQFHPESILTEHGRLILRNLIELAMANRALRGLEAARDRDRLGFRR